MNKKEALKEVLKDKKLRLLIIPIIFTSVLFVGATFAWFNFYSDINANVAGHVVSWNIDFDKGSALTNEYTITIDKIAPGMEEFSSPLTITNSGEVAADINYRIKSIKIFGNEISIGDTVDGDVLDPIKMKQYIDEKYPFKFSFDVLDDVVNPGNETTFDIKLNWAFETYKSLDSTAVFDENTDYYIKSGEVYNLTYVSSDNFETQRDILFITNDEEDTKWGEDAQDFITSNPSTPCIELKIEVSAVQHLE